MQTVEMKSPQKNRDKVSEMKTFEIKVWQGMIKERLPDKKIHPKNTTQKKIHQIFWDQDFSKKGPKSCKMQLCNF